MAVYVCSYRDILPPDYLVIDTTSHSTNWSKELSPFFLGPCKLYADYISLNMENAWQYSKVYKEFVDENNNPTDLYFEWAKYGWNNPRAVRYPMGKNKVPKYSWWDGNKYNYIDARKNIYIPLYSERVVLTDAFKKLKELKEQDIDFYLRDFDGYDYTDLGMSLEDVINNQEEKMGHAFVLAMLLQ
jgi:hypothetical protein